jgi:glycosyltransferase involved in cell wall biosynthesis
MQRHANTLFVAGFDVLLVGRVKMDSIQLRDENYSQKRLKCFFQKGKLFYLEYNLRLLWFLMFIKTDIHVAVDLDTILPNTIVAKLKGNKLVFDAHEYFTEVPELEGRVITKAIWQLIANTCIPSADKCYTVGPVLAELFANQYQSAFTTIMNVPKLSEDNLQKETPQKIIFYQGALNEGRGLTQLIQAMNFVEAELWIAGEGDLSKKLREQVSEMHLQNKVKFLGFVEPKELPSLTKKAFLGCNILEAKGLSYQYSLANKFFDYIHAGIPQICADFLEYQKINEIFPVAVLTDCSEQALIVNINKLLNNNELYQNLQNNCLKAAQVYNLQIESKKLVEIYKSLH